ncbi:hypothetical protein ABZ608_22360 [Streptomyces sp. NPDC013172]|uniref:hypothetical protein n=1 Tax=Streptomyces sp. NPDC013172 TaxID=3155009 RepID=UPI0033E29C39
MPGGSGRPRRGLHRFATLRQLSLASLRDGLTAADYEEIARLPALWELRLNNVTGTEDLSEIRTFFPSLRKVTLVLSPGLPEVPERLLAELPVTPVVQRVDGVV